MFGLFKQKVTPTEFGQAILYLVEEFLASDAGRSLGMRFPNWLDRADASEGWSPFLERNGVSVSIQKLNFILYTHCAIQAACTQFEEEVRREVTQGAIECFKKNIIGYDFKTTYNTLEAAYKGQHKFDQRIQPLSNPGATINFLPDPKVGVVNAKYLIEAFAIPRMPNGAAFLHDFQSYSSTVCASIGTVQRALDHLFKRVKIVRTFSNDEIEGQSS